MAQALLSSLAVLIDAQNVPATHAARIFREVESLGTTTIRRAYGDWSDPRLSGWRAVLPVFAIQPMQQFNNVAGKDVADMALIIDAMDLLHAHQHTGFCIVSSDSDFAGLAVRVRQQGLKVFGIGEAKTPKSFVGTCNRFFVLTVTPAQKPMQPDASISLPHKQPLTAADLKVLKTAIVATANAEGWADVAAVGTYLAQHTPLKIRQHAANLSKLLRVCGIAEVVDTSKTLRVRLKQAA